MKGKIYDRWSTLVNPGLPIVGRQLHGITDADVKDAVKAYWLLVTKCPPGEVYNIGGVETMTVGEMLKKLLKLSKVKSIRVETDPARLRPSDVTLQIPCIDKFQAATGWRPVIKFDRTLADLLDYWREFYARY